MIYSWRDVEEVDAIQLTGTDCEEVSSQEHCVIPVRDLVFQG